MKIRAKLKISTVLLLLVGSIGFSLLSWLFLTSMLNHKYLQVVDLILFLVSTFFASASIYYLLKNEVLNIDNNHLIRETFFGINKSNFKLSELISYTEIDKENKYIKWQDLDLFFKKGKVRITSSNLKQNQYSKIKNHIIKGIERNHKEESKWENKNARNFGIGFIIVWSLLSLVFINQDEQGNRIISSASTTQINGIIAENPEIESGKRNKQKLNIKLREFSDFNFKLNGQELKALDDRFIEEVSKGDKLSVKIWNETYAKKIKQTEKLSFREKHINYHQIEILGINRDETDYIPENRINRLREKFHSKWNYYGLMAMAFFGICFGLYLIILSRKAR